MSWVAPMATGETPKGPRLRKARPADVDATTPPETPIEDVEQTPPNSPFGNFPAEDNYPRVPDPSNLSEGRTVSTKQSNRPFIAYKNYRDKLDAEHAAWVKRMKEREEKIKRGEPVGPAEPDPREEQEVGWTGLLKLVATIVIFTLLAGKFFTGSYVWNFDGDVKSLWPDKGMYFTEKTLRRHDGSNPALPVYLAIDGEVYDVSANKRVYGPGGGYSHFAGKDAARAYGTGCFREHQTHDLRGLDEKQLEGVGHWKKFFKDHKSYKRVGRVYHPPIDPNAPIPEMCDLLNPKEEEAPVTAGPQPKPAPKHQEL